LRSVELALKKEVEKRDQLQSKHDESPRGQSEISPQELASEPIIIDWDAFYQTTPEAACCITAAEAAPLELPWPVCKDDASQYQLPPVMWADAFADAPLSETDKSSPILKEGTDINGTPLSPQMGVEYILQYNPKSHFFSLFSTFHPYLTSRR